MLGFSHIAILAIFLEAGILEVISLLFLNWDLGELGEGERERLGGGLDEDRDISSHLVLVVTSLSSGVV